MTDNPLDLEAFSSTEQVSEAQRTCWSRVLDEHLGDLGTAGGWPEAIAQLRHCLDRDIRRGEVNVGVAAHRQFTLDLMDAAYAEADLESARHMLDTVQTMHPNFHYAEMFHSLMRAHHRHYPERFAEHVQRALLRRLYRTIWDRMRPLAHEARRGSDTYDRWLFALARLAVALWERRLAPVTTRTEEGGASITLVLDDAGQLVGAKTELPGREICHPLAEWLLEPGQYEEARREDAYAAEQFAHLFTVFRGGYWRQEWLTELAAMAQASFGDSDRRAARQELRFIRARYKAPAYLVESLDRVLARPVDAHRGNGRG